MKVLIKFLLVFAFIFSYVNANQTENENSTQDKNQTKEALAKEISSKLVDINDSQAKQSLANDIANMIVEEEDSITDKENDITLNKIISKIIDINIKMELLKDSQKNSNSTVSTDVSTLMTQKQDLLDKIPNAILNQKPNKDEILNFLDQKAQISKNLKKYEKNKNSKEYILARIDDFDIANQEIFSTLMFDLENMFIEGTNQAELKNIIQNTILKFKAVTIDDITQSISGLSQEDQNLVNTKLGTIEQKEKAYDEIMEFLLKNTSLLSSNIIFTTLNLKGVIDFINLHVPFSHKYINFGKLILIIFMIVFFYSLRKFFAQIIYFCISLFTKKNKQTEGSKHQIIDVLKKPIGYLLIAYAVEICSVIFYYPTPVPLNFSKYFGVVYIILYSWFVIKLVDGYGLMLMSKIANKGARKDILNMTIKIAYFFIAVIAILLILKHIGFNVSTILASLGIGGLAVALATKDIIANFFASVMLLFDNSFSQGDWIVCGNVEGTVVEIGFRKTTVRTFDNALVFVPNSNIMTQSIKNWSRRKVGRRIRMNIGLTYSSTPAQIKNCIKDIKQMLLNHPGIAKPTDNALNSQEISQKYKQNSIISIDDLVGYKSTFFVVLDEFAESSINIMIYCFSKTVVWGEFLDVKEDVLLKIMDILDKNGVSLAFPSKSVYIETVPEITKNEKEK